ncbi:MAG: SGNH/GDSL hydrolase family protein [Betaproteobacteria bacterium]
MPLVYVALGDSVAAGYRAAPGHDYVAQLHRYLRRADPGWRLLRLARPGATTADLYGQVRRALAARPDLITVNIGGNDLRRAYPDPLRVLPVSMHHLDWALGTLRRRSRARVFVADVYNPVPPGSRLHEPAARWIGAFNRELGRVVARHRCVYVPIGEALAHSGGQAIASDGLHPSTAGHSVIAAAFLGAGLSRMARLTR